MSGLSKSQSTKPKNQHIAWIWTHVKMTECKWSALHTTRPRWHSDITILKRENTDSLIYSQSDPCISVKIKPENMKRRLVALSSLLSLDVWREIFLLKYKRNASHRQESLRCGSARWTLQHPTWLGHVAILYTSQRPMMTWAYLKATPVPT